MRRSLLIALTLLLLLGRPARVQAAPVTLEQYRQQVAEAYAAAQRADRIGLDQIATQLLAVTSVQLPDATPLPVNNSWLQAALAQEPPDYQLITARLGAILDAFGQPRTDPDPAALAKLDGVFQVPPFKDREVPSAWTSFWRGVGSAIERFFRAIGNLFRSAPRPNPPRPIPSIPTPTTSAPGISGLGTLLLMIGIALVLALLWYAVRSVRGSIVREAKVRKTVVDDGEELTSTEALAKAQTEAQVGDHRVAVRYLYLASLLHLHERRLLRYDRSLTNREYLQQLTGQPLRTQLAPIVETFDSVWYGKQPLDAAEFTTYEQQIAALRAQQGRP